VGLAVRQPEDERQRHTDDQGRHDREIKAKFSRSITMSPGSRPSPILGHQFATGLSAESDFTIELPLSERLIDTERSSDLDATSCSVTTRAA
jgi:hypothetical protein